jgi:hypothetical protein
MGGDWTWREIVNYTIELLYRPGVVSRFVRAVRDQPLEYVVIAERLRAFEQWLMANYSTEYEAFPPNHEFAQKLLIAAHDRVQAVFTVEKKRNSWWRFWEHAEIYLLTIHDLKLTAFPTV